MRAKQEALRQARIVRLQIPVIIFLDPDAVPLFATLAHTVRLCHAAVKSSATQLQAYVASKAARRKRAPTSLRYDHAITQPPLHTHTAICCCDRRHKSLRRAELSLTFDLSSRSLLPSLLLPRFSSSAWSLPPTPRTSVSRNGVARNHPRRRLRLGHASRLSFDLISACPLESHRCHLAFVFRPSSAPDSVDNRCHRQHDLLVNAAR